MKKKDVKVGGEYLTNVSGSLVRVRVIRAVPPRLKFGGGVQCGESGPSRFRVARVDNGTELPKPRTAAGLYPVVPTDIVARAGEKLAREHAAEGIFYGEDEDAALCDIIKMRFPRAQEDTVSRVLQGYRSYRPEAA